MLKNKCAYTCILAALVLSAAGALNAQTTFATITGTVTDPTGAVIPNVTITATATSRPELKQQPNPMTPASYTLAQLKEGEYR